jgi:K+-transporting ATPase ATPase A chain
MLLGRLVPMVLVLKLSGNIAAKKITPASSGTLPTNDMLFAVLLAVIIIIIGGLTFLPALALGPLSEHMFLFH